MTKNMGSTDRIIRLLVAVGIVALYFTNTISGTLAIILGIVAVVFVATSMVSFCPLYAALKLSTLKKQSS
jgi:uncharacterized membrane protein